MPDTPVGPTPPSPDLEFRVTKLEQDMGDVKSVLGQIVPLLARIDATMTSALPHLVTKADLQSAFGILDGKISDLDGTLNGKIGDLRSEMHSELGKLRADLAEKPGKTYLWMVLGVLIIEYAAGWQHSLF